MDSSRSTLNSEDMEVETTFSQDGVFSSPGDLLCLTEEKKNEEATSKIESDALENSMCVRKNMTSFEEMEVVVTNVAKILESVSMGSSDNAKAVFPSIPAAGKIDFLKARNAEKFEGAASLLLLDSDNEAESQSNVPQLVSKSDRITAALLSSSASSLKISSPSSTPGPSRANTSKASTSQASTSSGNKTALERAISLCKYKEDIDSESDWEDTVSDTESSSESESSADETGESNFNFWIPPEPLSQKEFFGIPTYVEEDGTMYIVTSDEGSENLLRIQSVLSDKLEHKKMTAKKRLHWYIGQVCTALYPFDNKWHRGKVVYIDLEAQKLDILFVDYGNVETVPTRFVHQKTSLGKLPIQCHKCRIGPIEPTTNNNKWSLEALDFMHRSAIGYEGFMKVERHGDEMIVMSLIHCGPLDFFDLMVKLNYARPSNRYTRL